MRVVPLVPSGPLTLRRSRACERCGRPTREGKPFCTLHVEDLPYARRIAGQWARIAASIATRLAARARVRILVEGGVKDPTDPGLAIGHGAGP